MLVGYARVSAEVALAVSELRRLCGWTKKYGVQALKMWSEMGGVDPILAEHIDGWAQNATKALGKVRSGYGVA